MSSSSQSKTIISFIYSLGGGGAERLAIHLANEAIKNGYKSKIFVASPVNDYYDEINSNVDIVLMPSNSNRYYNIVKLGRFIKFNTKNDNILRIISHMEGMNCLVLRLYLSRYINVKPIVVEHNDIIEKFKRKSSFKAIFRLIERIVLYRFSRFVVGVSSGVTKGIKCALLIPEHMIKTIVNPTDVDKILKRKLFLDQRDIPKTRSFYGKDYIIAVGRLHEQKGFDILVRSFSKIAQIYPNLDLVILGEGPTRGLLESLVADLNLTGRIHIPGFVKNPYYFIAHSKMFVLSSRHEGLGLVILEALVCDVKIVSTRCKWGPEEILGMNYPYLCDVESVEHLQETILSALASTKIIEVEAPLTTPSQAFINYITE